jgi:hypothetical protein
MPWWRSSQWKRGSRQVADYAKPKGVGASGGIAACTEDVAGIPASAAPAIPASLCIWARKGGCKMAVMVLHAEG